MADTRPTPLGFLGALRLCVLLLFFPQKFIAAQQADVANREGYKEGQEEEHGAYTVRRAFGYSLLLVVLFGGGGFLVGMGLGSLLLCVPDVAVNVLQVMGTSLLLWGTLFVRGWEIQTYSGVSFTERVNQWLYRFLYCIGTAALLCSLALTPCAK